MTLFMETLAQHIKAREGQGKGKVDSWENGHGGKQSPYPNSISTFLHGDFLFVRANVCGYQIKPKSPKSPETLSCLSPNLKRNSGKTAKKNFF